MLPLPWDFHGDVHGASRCLHRAFMGYVYFNGSSMEARCVHWDFRGASFVLNGTYSYGSSLVLSDVVLPWCFHDDVMVLCLHGVFQPWTKIQTNA